MRRTLSNARILLTGASNGLGRELAVVLAARGARLWLVARREPLIARVAAECRALAAEAEYSVGDVGDAQFRLALVESLQAKWGALDVLLNNAGINALGPFETSDEHTLRQVMEVNFFAPVELTRLALPLLRAGTNPAIDNIASVLGHRATPLNAEYCASKFALRGWSESVRAELAVAKIDVLWASPGTIDTEFFEHSVAKRSKPPWGAMKGISARAAAEQIVRGLERNRREVFPNRFGHAMVLANKLAPGLVDFFMKRLARKK